MPKFRYRLPTQVIQPLGVFHATQHMKMRTKPIGWGRLTNKIMNQARPQLRVFEEMCLGEKLSHGTRHRFRFASGESNVSHVTVCLALLGLTLLCFESLHLFVLCFVWFCFALLYLTFFDLL